MAHSSFILAIRRRCAWFLLLALSIALAGFDAVSPAAGTTEPLRQAESGLNIGSTLIRRDPDAIVHHRSVGNSGSMLLDMSDTSTARSDSRHPDPGFSDHYNYHPTDLDRSSWYGAVLSRNRRDSLEEINEMGIRDQRDNRDIRDARNSRDVWDVRDVRDSRQARDVQDTRDARDSRDVRETRDVRDQRDARGFREIRDAREARDARDAREAREARESRESRESRDAQEAQEAREAREAREMQEIRDVRGAREMREVMETMDHRDLRQARDSRAQRESNDFRDVRAAREARDYRDSQDYRDATDSRDQRDARDFLDLIGQLAIRGMRDARDKRDAMGAAGAREARDKRDEEDFKGAQKAKKARMSRGGSMLQERRKHKHEASLAAESTRSQSCLELSNYGSSFGTRIVVGTPFPNTTEQSFDVVVDTGSDSVIVPSCICVRQGGCDPASHCYKSANRSSTFGMQQSLFEVGGGMRAVSIPVGNGSIKAIPTTDVVKVGSVSAKLVNGLLLMVERTVNTSQTFEGVLGLGLPSTTKSKSQTVVIHTQGGYDFENKSGAVTPQAGALLQTNDDANEVDVLRGGFLEAANISTFSVCFNDGEKPGILRLGTEPTQNQMVSMGKLHWGLGLSGVSVGNESQHPILCNAWEKQQKDPNFIAACGAVPDTGSTAIMAPTTHLVKLFESICNQWPRCVSFSQRLERLAVEMANKEVATPKGAVQATFRLSQMLLQVEAEEVFRGSPDTSFVEVESSTQSSSLLRREAAEQASGQHSADPVLPKSTLRASSLLSLLDNCASWMQETNGSGLAELPNVSLQLKGDGDEPQTIYLSGWSYVYEVMEPDAARVRAPLRDIYPAEILNRTVNENRKVCTPAFAAVDKLNHGKRPLWILGQPIFMQYQVGFSRNTPLSMSFTPIKSCTACSTDPAKSSLLQVNEESGSHRSPRMIRGPFRLPSLDERRLSEFL